MCIADVDRSLPPEELEHRAERIRGEDIDEGMSEEERQAYAEAIFRKEKVENVMRKMNRQKRSDQGIS